MPADRTAAKKSPARSSPSRIVPTVKRAPLPVRLVIRPTVDHGSRRLVVDIRPPATIARMVDLSQPTASREPAIAPPVLTTAAGQFTKPVPTLTSNLGRRVGNWAVTITMVLGIVIGVPKLLTAVLHTPFPMAAITSGSMWPELKIGDLVFIQGVKPEQIRVGDIVVFRNDANNSFTIHRVVNLDEDTLTTKGDANFKSDPPVPYAAVVGRTLNLASSKPLHLPYLGSITVFASNLGSNE